MNIAVITAIIMIMIVITVMIIIMITVAQNALRLFTYVPVVTQAVLIIDIRVACGDRHGLLLGKSFDDSRRSN